MKRTATVAGLIVLITNNFIYAQSSPLQFKQTREGSQLEALTPSEIATLGDPLFNLLLKNKANIVKLAGSRSGDTT